MRLRKFLPFVLLIAVLLVAACAPVTPVIPQTGPDTQGTASPDTNVTAMPGDNGQGGTGTGTEGSGTGTGTGTDGTGSGTGTDAGGTGSGTGGTGGTDAGGSDSGGTGSQGGNLGNTGGTGGNTAPSPSGSQNNMSQGLQDSISGFVSEQSGAASGDVEILFAQQIDFQDGCLGLSGQGEGCTQVVTPGWQVVARSNGNLYVIHTDSNGNNVRLNENADPNAIIGSGAGGTGTGTGDTGTGGTGTGSGSGTGGSTGGAGGTDTGGSNQGGGGVGGSGVRVSLDQVINLASQFLGQTLNVPVNQISFTGVSVETWADSCLGAGRANESCAQITTPGYRVTFSVAGQTYELRTDNTGSNIRLVQGAQQ